MEEIKAAKIAPRILLLVVIISTCAPAETVNPRREISPSDHLQGSMNREAVGIQRSSNYCSRTDIASRNKFASGGHGGGGHSGGGHGGHPAFVSGSGAHDDGSHPQGTSGMIPLYAAGVAGATTHHNYHGKHNGGAPSYSSIGLVTLCVTASVCHLLRTCAHI